jgi:hypothetical protein
LLIVIVPLFFFLSDAASRYPNKEEILEKSEQIGMSALIKVSNGPMLGESASDFQKLLGHVVSISSGPEFKKFVSEICTEMVQGIGKVKYLLPSALVNCLMEDQEKILGDPDFSDVFIKILKLNEHFNPNVCAQFFLKFMLFFTTDLLQFISQAFKAKHPFRAVSRTVGDPDKEDRQVIYYIAGSIMRGYLRIARRFPQSKSWQEIVSVLKSKVLTDRFEGDLSTDANWTKDVDRGGLLFINSKCQELFVKIAKVVYSSEKQDGSIDYEAVIKEVCNSELSHDWDDIICESLSETVSLNFLSDIIQYFCKTCGRGIAKRRLNFIRRRPVASMNTRHLAASRKNR